MKRSMYILFGLMMIGGLLLSSGALAGKGGIPWCEVQLNECLIDLKICETTEGQAYPATGQKDCFDSTGTPIPCAGTGQDGDIQAGADLSYTDNGLTITDNNTKLEWMKQDDNNGDCGNYPDNLDKDCFFYWDETFAVVAELNANNHAGYSDWRVPNIKELQSIVHYQTGVPAVSDEFNTGCVAGCRVETCSCSSAYSWSSTSEYRDPDSAWEVWFDLGDTTVLQKDSKNPVRVVRGGLYSANTIAATNLATEVADVFISRLRAPKSVNTSAGRTVFKSITVFGDGVGITQDASVILSASNNSGLLTVNITPTATTESVTPGNPNTRFRFGADITCNGVGSDTIALFATIDAAENADPTNDTLDKMIPVICR